MLIPIPDTVNLAGPGQSTHAICEAMNHSRQAAVVEAKLGTPQLFCPHVGQHGSDPVAGDLRPDEALGVLPNIEKADGAPHRPIIRQRTLNQEARINQRLSKPAEAGHRQTEPYRQLPAGHRSVDEDGPGEFPYGFFEFHSDSFLQHA